MITKSCQINLSHHYDIGDTISLYQFSIGIWLMAEGKSLCWKDNDIVRYNRPYCQ